MNDHTLAPTIQKTLAVYKELSDGERRLFWSTVLHPSQNSQAQAPGEAVPEDPWQAFTLEDAYVKRPPVEYVAAGLFALPSLNIVYGAPGTLKSFLLADLAVCVASGNEWLTPANWISNNHARSFPTRKGPAMWLDFDNGRRRTHDRFGALGRARQLPKDTPLIYYSMPNPWLDAGSKKDIGSLTLRMLEHDVRLIVVDNLGVVSGDADENSGDMVGVMSMFRQLAEETNAAVILIHHQRKGNGSIGRAGDSLRGHSSIEAALDLALLIEREELADTISIKATKVRGDDVLPFSATFSKSKDDYGELSTARFFGIANDDTRSDYAIEREILAALIDTSMNKTELAKAVKDQLPDIGQNRIRDRIDRLAKENRLHVANGKHNTEKIYSRNNG